MKHGRPSARVPEHPTNSGVDIYDGLQKGKTHEGYCGSACLVIIFRLSGQDVSCMVIKGPFGYDALHGQYRNNYLTLFTP